MAPRRKQRGKRSAFSNLSAADVERLRALSLLTSRADFAESAGLSFGESGIYKRDLFAALGYDRVLEARQYQDRYKRGGIAERIVECYPRATWVAGTEIVEDEDPNSETKFEKSVADLFEARDIWARLQRVDILARQGRYAVLLIGAAGDSDLSTEMPRLRKPDDILYISPFSERKALIARLVTDAKDKRFGLPESYNINLGINIATNQPITSGQVTNVHWSRVIHVAEGLSEDNIYGKPPLRAIWNYLDDLDKVVGGGAEAFWLRANPGIQVDTDPEFEFDEDQEKALKDEIDEYEHKMRRTIRTEGVELKMMDVAVAAFGPNAESVLQLISATTGIPFRILTGSERGKLASTQDRDNWNDRVDERRREFAVPLIKQLVNRLIEYGALPKPAQFDVSWPRAEEMDEKSKAEVILARAKANQAQVLAGDTIITTSDEMRDEILDLPPLAEVAPEIVAQQQADKKAKADAAAAAANALNNPPNPNAEPDNSSQRSAAAAEADTMRRVAERHAPKLMALFLAAWLSASTKVEAAPLERLLSMGNRVGSEKIVFDALDAMNNEMMEGVSESLHETLSDGAMATLRSARKRGSWLRSSRATQMHAAAEFDASFDANNPRAIDWAETRAGRLITEIDRETRDGIRELIAEGLRDGIPPRQLSKRIQDLIGLRSDQVASLDKFASQDGVTQAQIDKYAAELLRDRALLIARTESGGAANAGTKELWMQAQDNGDLAKNEMRVWIGTNDGREREEHVELNGQVVPIRAPFVIPSTGRAIEPGEDPNCRCAQGIATPEDIANMPAPPAKEGEISYPLTHVGGSA